MLIGYLIPSTGIKRSHPIQGFLELYNVYLGAMTAVLQTSTAFLMNQQQTHLLNAQIGLVRQQTVTELANTCDSVPQGLGFNHIPQEITPIPPIS